MTEAIFSIRTVFSQAILRGIKKVELRTNPPKKPIDCIWIYETAPTKAIVGHFVPGKINLPMQWRALRETFGYTGIMGTWEANEEREVTLENVFGDKLWSAIQITEAHCIEPLDPVEVWRHASTGWRSPQSWRYLERWEATRLKMMAREVA
ncbi:ASCH domain-containing protein [Candidatus Pacearchaeota archaeon]|jgi:predicted transcriptional regulator|nr:ASCH domain-containing protein [Candidatus Pacearchaeota archaeon]